MVAMSMADGYARLTSQPQAVIVHVDVGTQGLGAAVHNASTGRAPVLVFAGLSPFTIDGELRGSRTEFIHWIQDVPDQKAIVAQYCRYAGELRAGANVREMVNRALQFARSDPQGPTYLCGAREVMEAEIPEGAVRQEEWEPVRLGGLPVGVPEEIAKALVGAKEPLLLTGYAGRNHAIVEDLVRLADGVKRLRVLDTGGSDMCFPADHPAWLGLRYGVHDAICSADVILVLDCDVPWIPTQCRPRSDAKIFHVDVDPLKQMMPVFYIPAQQRFRADARAVVGQLNDVIATYDQKTTFGDVEAEGVRKEAHVKLLAGLEEKFGKPFENGSFGTGYLCRTLRRLCPQDTIWAVEAVTNTLWTHDGLRPTLPGSWINCGGGGLGWSGGAALGIKLAAEREGRKGKFVVQIVGDGTFLFSVPGSVYWISRRYKIPVLTIVLNNKGESLLHPLSTPPATLPPTPDPLFHLSALTLLFGSYLTLIFPPLRRRTNANPPRLERPPPLLHARPPRGRGLPRLQRGDQHLLRPLARLRRHSQGGRRRRAARRARGQRRRAGGRAGGGDTRGRGGDVGCC